MTPTYTIPCRLFMRAGKAGFLIPALLVFLSAGMTGCITVKQPYNKISYYTLEYDPPPISDLTPLPASIRIERFTVAPSYNTENMIFREKAYTRDAYPYHKWHANPGRLVQDFLKRDLLKSGLFTAVFPATGRFAASYVLNGSVDEFLEQDNAKNWEVVLAVSVTLLAANEPNSSKQIVFQKSFTKRQTCEKKNPQAVAKAMSFAMSALSTDIIRTIHAMLGEKRLSFSM